MCPSQHVTSSLRGSSRHRSRQDPNSPRNYSPPPRYERSDIHEIQCPNCETMQGCNYRSLQNRAFFVSCTPPDRPMGQGPSSCGSSPLVSSPYSSIGCSPSYITHIAAEPAIQREVFEYHSPTPQPHPFPSPSPYPHTHPNYTLPLRDRGNTVGLSRASFMIAENRMQMPDWDPSSIFDKHATICSSSMWKAFLKMCNI
ncbi:hypothetical protein BX661DRAFT_169919 [Kickxella alabastrina]|uniref:uncharacterized protein n=1 Tax=Kickxella alabastrina TaxID=61397 RepID=UPI002220F612|nr:uncharacterized protein BX661DRAFT_169919 [Kickxella alabastrina]KAI7832092.1 hypothetical protein BX661DRAFT_169919 [Kickxella alabastrina]